MSGELLPAWSQSWKELWVRLAKSSGMPEDPFATIVDAAFAPRRPEAPSVPPATAFNSEGDLVDAGAIAARDNYVHALSTYNLLLSEYEVARTSKRAAKAFFRQRLTAISSESQALAMLELIHRALNDRVSEAVADRFHELVQTFFLRFNLRYELRHPFLVTTTISGVFSTLASEIKSVASADAHLAALVREFEEAYADLKQSRSQTRMKTCLQKQFNLLEGLGRRCPNVTRNTLGAICEQLDWPHDKVKETGKNLYAFGSDYPGLRHAGTPANAHRDLNMRDFVSISLMLASFAPYVAHSIDYERCYTA